MRFLQRIICLLITALALASVSPAQNSENLLKLARLKGEKYPCEGYISPLPEPLALSGSFGEIRNQHFHTGTDLRTGGREGLVVRATRKGEVARVNVSTRGYGYAVYVQHDNGTQTVYCHLQAFAPEIDDWVRDQQYQREQYEVVLYPPSGLFPLEQGDMVGWSGNTGSSAGPHLHYEVRFTRGSVPFDPKFAGLNYTDNTPPSLKKLYLYAVDTTNYEASLRAREGYTLRNRGSQYWLADTLRLPEVAGLGLEANDFVNSSSLKSWISSIEISLDGKPQYYFDVKQIDFTRTAYADAHIDYMFRQDGGDRLNLLFRLPGNNYDRYWMVGNGLLRLKPGECKHVRIEVKDASGNSSTLNFIAKGLGRFTRYSRPIGSLPLLWNEVNDVIKPEYLLHIPKGALYYDIHYVDEVNPPSSSTMHAPRVSIHQEDLPLHLLMTLALRGDSLAAAHEKSVYMAKFDKKSREFAFFDSVKHSTADSMFRAPVRGFGTYTLMIDTVPPIIDPADLAKICGASLPKVSRLEVHVRDGETQVKKVSGAIDGQWALWEWEPKTGQAFLSLDPKRFRQGGSHQFQLKVTDAVGNVNTVECPFTW